MIDDYDATHQIRLLLARDVGSISVQLRDGTISIVAPQFVLGDGLLQWWTAETVLKIAIAEIVGVAANGINSFDWHAHCDCDPTAPDGDEHGGNASAPKGKTYRAAHPPWEIVRGLPIALAIAKPADLLVQDG
jgi:hypothetical protein